jgi:hypothetical protein
MFTRLLPLFVLALGLIQGGHDKTKDKAKEPAAKPSPDADLVALAKDLDAGGKDKVAEIVHAFAQKHAAKDKAVTMTSADKKVHVVLGAPGSEKSPNAPDVDFKAEGTQYNIAVGGKGGDAAKADNGGTGGSIKLSGKAAGKTYLFGGDGGAGAKKGGKGGSVWTGKDWAAGDNVATGGKGGSPGGEMGEVGAEPKAEPKK